MDPNPLQYQAPNENQPLYRAGLLSAAFVAVLIVLALGINFVIHHSDSNGVTARRSLDTSPDDTVNGMRRELAGDSSGTTTEVSGSFPTAGSIAANTDRPTFVPSVPTYGASPAAPTPLMAPKGVEKPPAMTNGQALQNRPMPPLQVSAMRDWASIDPENIDDLLAGR